MNKIQKLFIIKNIIIAVSTVVIFLGGFVAALKPFKLPLIWLRHYVLGSGVALKIPSEEVVKAKEALMTTIIEDGAKKGGIRNGYHCVYHSTLYKGVGFYGRPTLFYLVGGFTFLLRRDWLVSGKDRYDWHPDGEGNYFTSPLGDSKVVSVLITLLDKLFGNEWFVKEGFPSHETGISNKLWADLELVGAAPFWSYFDKVEAFTETDTWQMSVSVDAELRGGCNYCVNAVDKKTAKSLAPEIGGNDYYFIAESCCDKVVYSAGESQCEYTVVEVGEQPYHDYINEW